LQDTGGPKARFSENREASLIVASGIKAFY